MSERVDLGQIHFTDEQVAAMEGVAQEALGVVTRTYGSGYPTFRGGENLPFHNAYHSVAVARDGVIVGSALGMSRAELVTIRAASMAHDIVQDGPRGVIELASADWFGQQIEHHPNLPAAVAAAGHYAIVGTEPKFNDEGKLVGQVVEDLIFPSRSLERVAKSVACGDFGELYSPRGPLMARRLFQEIYKIKPDDEPPMEKLLAFWEKQNELWETYRFPLCVAERVLATHKRQVVEYGAQVLKQLQRGGVTSWRQLEQQDVDFMRRHS